MRVNVVETIASPVRTSFKGGEGGEGLYLFLFLPSGRYLVLELFLVCKEESMCRQL